MSRRRRPREAAPAVRLPTGEQYLASLRDGRRVWMFGQGPIEDVTTHPATAAMASQYADWYDRHRNTPWFEPIRSVDQLRRLGQAIQSVAFETGGNMTHTPAYGALIALGAVEAARTWIPKRADAVAAFRDQLADSGRFLTFSSGGGPPADRFHAAAGARAVRAVKRARGGVVVDGVAGVHTAVPFAHDVLILGRHPGGARGWAWLFVPVAAPGVRVIARQASPRPADPFDAPLSHRFDELDAMLELDDVFIPAERIVALGDQCQQPARDSLQLWLYWHQAIGWMARANFSLGLALALLDADGRAPDPAAVDAVVDMIVDVETVRACLVASELDAVDTPGGFVAPRMEHLAPASIRALEMRQRHAETLRRLAGAAAMIAPTAADLADPRIARDVEAWFGGGGATARERAALLQLIRDHIGSSLDAREAAYELFGNGGRPAWRQRIRAHFPRYDKLIRGVRELLARDTGPALSTPPPAAGTRTSRPRPGGSGPRSIRRGAR